MSFTPNINRIKDRDENEAVVSGFGQLITGARREDILVRFEYSNSTYDVTPTTSGTGVTSNANSMARAESGAGIGAASIVSVRSLVYRPAHEVYGYFTAVFSTGQDANTYQRIGLFDSTDGLWVGYSGASFGVAIIKGGSTTFVAQSSFNADKCDGTGRSGFNLNKTFLNQYRITYGWLGIHPLRFAVFGGEDLGWITMHTFDFTNAQATPSMFSPSTYMRVEAGRTSGAGSSVYVDTASWAAGSLEGLHVHAGHRVFAGSATSALAAGVSTMIATFRNKSTYQGKTNKVLAEAVYLGGATDGTKNAQFSFVRNATITGGAWSDINTANSVMEANTTCTYAGGTTEMVVPMAKVDTIALDLGAGHFHLELFPGETMTIVGFSTGASDVIISFRWEEYFA